MTPSVDPCVIDGCGKPRKRGRRYCSMHTARIARHGDPEAVCYPPSSETCVLDGCERPARSGRYCSMHAARIRRHGDPDVVKAHRTPRLTGSEHPQWRGDDIGYSGIHRRVYAARGAARRYVCACGEPAQEWAYVGPSADGILAHSASVDDYEAMCRSCHRHHDADVRARA